MAVHFCCYSLASHTLDAIVNVAQYLCANFCESWGWIFFFLDGKERKKGSEPWKISPDTFSTKNLHVSEQILFCFFNFHLFSPLYPLSMLLARIEWLNGEGGEKKSINELYIHGENHNSNDDHKLKIFPIKKRENILQLSFECHLN